jgi:hypothetical protein
VEDIRVHGLRETITLYEGAILDGRNRWRACNAAQVPARFKTYDGKDALAFVVSSNLLRRHLDASQRALIAAEIVERGLGKGRPARGDVRRGAGGRILLRLKIAKAAELLNVTDDTNQKGRARIGRRRLRARGVWTRSKGEVPDHWDRWPLRVGDARPNGRSRDRASEPRDEIAPSHSLSLALIRGVYRGGGRKGTGSLWEAMFAALHESGFDPLQTCAAVRGPRRRALHSPTLPPAFNSRRQRCVSTNTASGVLKAFS